MKERKDWRCIKGDATKSKKIDYFSNKIPEYLSKKQLFIKK